MRGVATNVYLWKTSEKPKETGQNENSKFGSCELYLRLRKVLAPLTLVSKDNSLISRIVELCYLNFYFFLFFEVDKSGAFAPTYPPLERKLDLRSSSLCVNQVILFYLSGDHFKTLDLKNDPFYLVRNRNDRFSKSYFCGRA